MLYLLALASVALGLCLSELHQTRQDLALRDEELANARVDRDHWRQRARWTTRSALWDAPAPKPVPADWAPGRTIAVIDTTGTTVEHPLPALTTGGR